MDYGFGGIGVGLPQFGAAWQRCGCFGGIYFGRLYKGSNGSRTALTVLDACREIGTDYGIKLLPAEAGRFEW